jgi:hypothetical protein
VTSGRRLPCWPRSRPATLKPKVADVLPVIGLIAESAESGGFTAADAERPGGCP